MKVNLLSAGKWIIFFQSVIFEIHCFSCLELPAGSSVTAKVTLFASDCKTMAHSPVPAAECAKGGPRVQKKHPRNSDIVLKSIMVYLFPFYLKGAKFCRVVLIADRITSFSSVCMTRLYSPWTVSCFACSGLPGLVSGKSSLKCLAELYFCIYI